MAFSSDSDLDESDDVHKARIVIRRTEIKITALAKAKSSPALHSAAGSPMGRGATANDTQGKGKVEGKGGCSDAASKSSDSDSDSDAAEKPADLNY